MTVPSPAAGRPGLPPGLVRWSLAAVLALCMLGFTLVNRSFLSPANLANVVQGSAIPLVVALAMTLVVAVGGVDLSVGVALDFGSAFAIVALKSHDAPWAVAMLAGILGGALIGLVNALLVARLEVSPFLATLGVYFIAGGVERIFTDGGGPISFRQLPAAYYAVAVGTVAGVPIQVLLAGALAIAYWLLLERSLFGRRIHAIGLQPAAARVSGLRVGSYLTLAFVTAAATCAVGGIFASANLRMFTPLAGNAYLMQAIAAVFMGASVHPRGRPSVPGTLLGVLFLGVVANGLNLVGLEFNVKDALSGLILLLALAVAVAQRRLLGARHPRPDPGPSHPQENPVDATP